MVWYPAWLLFLPIRYAMSTISTRPARAAPTMMGMSIWSWSIWHSSAGDRKGENWMLYYKVSKCPIQLQLQQMDYWGVVLNWWFYWWKPAWASFQTTQSLSTLVSAIHIVLVLCSLMVVSSLVGNARANQMFVIGSSSCARAMKTVIENCHKIGNKCRWAWCC